MIYEQNIPFYTLKFKDYPWKIYESGHYIFHVEEKSLAEKNIEAIKARQEFAYNKILTALVLKEPKKKIIYYFYPTQEKKAKLMGDGGYGQSIYNEFAVHAVYNKEHKVVGEHEDSHLLSLQLGLPISLFQEGLAEFMVGSSMFGNNHNIVVREGIQRGLSFNIKSLMSQQGWLDTPGEDAEFYYSVTGSFVGYLVDILDIKTFKKLYSAMDRKNSSVKNIKFFESITGKLIEKIEASLRGGIMLINKK